MRQRHKRILTFTGFGFIIGLLGVALMMQVWAHQRQVEDAAVARSLSVAKEISASRTASEQARQHAKNQTTQSVTMGQVSKMTADPAITHLTVEERMALIMLASDIELPIGQTLIIRGQGNGDTDVMIAATDEVLAVVSIISGYDRLVYNPITKETTKVNVGQAYQNLHQTVAYKQLCEQIKLT
ncbi:hypothetical protein [Weissella cibaria]|uniref:Uncharacterized protein n=1 Tax=Weissella cibaria TaxID=137591 RepID=A0A0D1JUX9_9LACO|nr:hypothetical protein [Weissella cibaria]KIU25033.1 hypothetical protein ab3b_00810 [Weissella cibaria]